MAKIGKKTKRYPSDSLDNRSLFCRPQGIARYRFLEDARDKPSNDKAWSWIENRPLRDPQGLSAPVYAAITAIVQGHDKELDALEKEVAAKAERQLWQLHLDEQALADALLETRIHMIDGAIGRTMLDSDDLLDFASKLERLYSNTLIAFTDPNGCHDFIPRHQIAVVDIPSSVYYSAMSERYPADRDMPLPESGDFPPSEWRSY